MPSPRLEVIPARPAVCHDAPTVLDILVRITPPLPEIHILRPPINLGIVLDRSGSMSSGRKMSHAREAARFAVGQMLPTDRLSLTIFDDVVETIVPSAPVVDKPSLAAKINGITPRGSTDLHGGWAAGAHQVLEHLVWQGMNRVLLVSDGLANVGLTDPGALCVEVRGMASREVNTSTIGVGGDYNEELLSGMAQAGVGNYYYVDNPVQLTDVFQTELRGLMGTAGRHVELSLHFAPGVSLAGVLSELERGPAGQILLPDLVCEMPISVLIRLQVEPRAGRAELCRFQLAWEATESPAPRRQQTEAALRLDSVSKQEWERLQDDPIVQDHFALAMSISTRDAMYGAIKSGQGEKAGDLLNQLRALVKTTTLGFETDMELEILKDLEQKLARGDYVSSSKLAHMYSYLRKRVQGSGQHRPPPPPGDPK